MKKILFLGANSTAGGYATYYFAKRGFEVVATSRSPQAHRLQLPYLFYDSNNVTYTQHSLNADITQHRELFESINPDYIVNFASQSMVGQSWVHPTDWMQTNCVGQTSLLEAMRDLNGLKLYVHFSTPEVYGSTNGWVDETHIFNPSTPYASSRMLGDINTKIWAAQYSIPTMITRAANIYSEGQHLYRIIPRAILASLNRLPLRIDGQGLSVRSFIHMHDVCTFLELALKSPSSYSEYHISDRTSITIIDLIKKIFSLQSISLADSPSVSYGPDRPGKDQSYLLDPAKAISDFQWQPTVSLDEGISRVVQWISSSPDIEHILPVNYSHKA